MALTRSREVRKEVAPFSRMVHAVLLSPVYIYIAMLASGGLGLMQKVQQSSRIAGEKMAFFLVAFVFAVLCSCVAYLICRKVQFTRDYTG